jgi:hypothetical protein
MIGWRSNVSAEELLGNVHHDIEAHAEFVRKALNSAQHVS